MISQSFIIIALDVSGVLYQPNTFKMEVFNHIKFMDSSLYGDNLWFYSMAVLNGTKTVLVKNALYHPKNTNRTMERKPKFI